MPRFISVLASVALLVMMAAPAAAREATPSVYLALGDSLAWGDGASVPDHSAYVPRLAGYFQGASHGAADDLVNLAIRGETTASMLTGQLPAALAVINDPDTDVRVVTLSIGGNDLLDLINDSGDTCAQAPASDACRQELGMAMLSVAANMPTIIGSLEAALAADPGTEKLFVLTLYNPFGGTASIYEEPIDQALLGADVAFDCVAAGQNPLNAGLNDIVGCTSAFLGGIVVESYDLFDDNALALTHIGEGFNIHPNDDGYALLAQAHRAADRAS